MQDGLQPEEEVKDLAKEVNDLRHALEQIAYPVNHPVIDFRLTFQQWASSVAANALTNAGRKNGNN